MKCLLILLFDEHGGDLATYYRASKDIFDITIFDESAGRMASFLSDTGKGHEMRFKDFVQNYADEAASGMASMFGEKKEDILRGIEQGAYRSIPQAHKDALEELRTAILERIKLTQTGQNAIAALDAANDHVMLHSAMPLPAKKYHELTRSQRKEADALLEKFNKKVEAAQRKVQHARREAEAARQNMFGAVRNAASPVDMFGNAANHAAGLQSARAALAEAERELQELQSGAAQYRQNVINFAGAQESMLHGLTPDQIRKMTLEDIKNMALKEMTSGKQVFSNEYIARQHARSVERALGNPKNSPQHKQRLMEQWQAFRDGGAIKEGSLLAQALGSEGVRFMTEQQDTRLHAALDAIDNVLLLFTCHLPLNLPNLCLKIITCPKVRIEMVATNSASTRITRSSFS